MKPIYHNLINALGLIILVVGGFILGNLIPLQDITSKIMHKQMPMSEQQIIDDCSGLDYRDTSYCLVSYIKPIYNFTETQDMFELDLDDLKRVGGDCKNWNDLYKKLGIGTGLKANTFSFYHDINEGHRIAIIHSDEGYCVVDQESVVGCFRYGSRE